VSTQFVDIAVAFGYAALCLSLVVLISPVVPREVAVENAAQVRLHSALSAYVGRVGLPFLNGSQLPEICRSTMQQSNSTFVFSVIVNGEESCGAETGVGASQDFLTSASMTLAFPERAVVIWARLLTPS
jgi:hypothetical protein